ncbi:MAG: LysM peptidoglycan-binding domain-containing protein, partial [Oscillospiraceae bacterium]|nr:LysM peptidoglycan-binding domain-containing protein [Oscillospiraceae bacterium]
KQITTIEGNVDNACRMLYRALTCVVGYGRPPYPADQAPAAGDLIHTVAAGETLSIIARNYSWTTWQAIAEYNSIKSPYTIYAGQKIKIPGKALKKGDVSGNGTVGIEDSRLILQYIVGKATLSADQLKAADINGDGKVDVADARLILQALVGKYTIK